MSLKSSTIFLHIGASKTGSSAIQAFLSLNHKLLEEKGYLYPDPQDFSQPYQTSSGNAVFLLDLVEKKDYNGIKERLGQFPQNYNIILSNENLLYCIAKDIENLFKCLELYKFKIIVYLRRQDEWIESAFNQLVKNHDLTEDIESVNIPNNAQIIVDLMNHVSLENILVRIYEREQLVEGNIYSDFLNCIGLESKENYVFPEEIVNPSLCRDALEFRRIVNKSGVDKNDYTKKIVLNEALAEFTVDQNKGRPFQSEKILPPSKRKEILDSHFELNSKIAKRLFNRPDGVLFLKSIDEDFRGYRGLSLDKIVKIMKFIGSKKGVDDQFLKEKLIHAFVEVLLESKPKGIYSHSAITVSQKNLFYSLDTLPINFSESIKNIYIESDKFIIVSKGDDPNFVLPNFPAEERSMTLKIILNFPHDSSLQLFYRGHGHRFNKENQITCHLKEGRNEVQVKLATEFIIKNIRIDTGNKPGIYTIESLEVFKI